MKKTILITGASSSIGKSTAKLFQDKGWNVIATMRTPENETELNTLENVLVTRLDVLDSTSITDAVNTGIEQIGLERGSSKFYQDVFRYFLLTAAAKTRNDRSL